MCKVSCDFEDWWISLKSYTKSLDSIIRQFTVEEALRCINLMLLNIKIICIPHYLCVNLLHININNIEWTSSIVFFTSTYILSVTSFCVVQPRHSYWVETTANFCTCLVSDVVTCETYTCLVAASTDERTERRDCTTRTYNKVSIFNQHRDIIKTWSVVNIQPLVGVQGVQTFLREDKEDDRDSQKITLNHPTRRDIL